MWQVQSVRISPARPGQTNRSKNTSVLLILFYGWSLLICLKLKRYRDSNITKQTESTSFWKSISVLFTCTITCTDGSYEYHWISVLSRAMKTQIMVIASTTKALNQVTLLRFIHVLPCLCREKSRYTH